MKSRIATWLSAALAAAGFGDDVEVMVEYSRSGHEGDFSTGTALALARGGDAERTPRGVAERIVAALDMIDGPAGSVVIAPNGYINIRCSARFLAGCAIEAVETLGVERPGSVSSIRTPRPNGVVGFRRAGAPVDRWPDGGDITLESLGERTGPDVVRWFLLAGPATGPLTIDLDVALDRNDRNPLYFVRYTRAHIGALFEFARGIHPPQGTNIPPFGLDILDSAQELLLMKSIATLPDIAARCIRDGETHPLTEGLLDIARHWHDFSRTTPLIGVGVERRIDARLSLTDLTGSALTAGLDLLGISSSDRI